MQPSFRRASELSPGIDLPEYTIAEVRERTIAAARGLSGRDRVIVFEGADYGKSADTFPVDCDQILRVGVYQGVPVFAVISVRRPLSVIFIPVRPGVWHRYERGIRRPEGL